MTSKQSSSSSTVSHSMAQRQAAAQILYRMANSSQASSSSAGASSLITEPITPVLVAGPTMLQPSPAHFAVATSGFQQAGGSGLQQSHNFMPLFFQPSPGGGPTQIKQDGSGMTFQFQAQQYQVLQQQPQQQGGQRIYQLNLPDGMNQQYQVARMANGGMTSPNPPQTVGKGRAGGRKPTNKEDKLTSEEQDRRKVRRERNKQAAARCRKRRMDQTNILTDETEGLEDIQNQLKAEIEKYHHDINEIQFILEAHRSACSKDIPVTAVQSRLPTPPRARSVGIPTAPTTTQQSDAMIMPPPPVISINNVPSNQVPAVSEPVMSAETGKKRLGGGGAPRPASLPVKSDLQQLDLLAMPTPSPSKLVFNFESHSGLTPTGLTPTGLTPLIPSCSTDGQEKSDQTPSTDASTEGTSPNNLVSL